MLKNKKILLLIAIIFIISAAYIIYQSVPKTPLGGVVTQPKIPRYFSGKYEVNLNVSETQFDFPSQVPLVNINLQTPISQEESSKIAANFGLTQSPDIVNDTFEGTTYFYSGAVDSIIVYAKSRKIEYVLNNPLKTANKQLTDKDIENTAKEFLTDKFLLDSDSIDFSFFTFLKEGGLENINITTKDQASIYQVNFSPKTGGYSFLTLDPKTSPLYVWVLPDGSIAKASAVKFEGAETTSTIYKLKSFQDLISSVNEAILVSLDDGNITLSNLTPKDLSTININEISLSYLMDQSKGNTLQPVFTLKGTAILKDQAEAVSAFLYLPAIKNP